MENSFIRISCIGDSITAGFGLEDWEDSYPNQLYYLLGGGYIINPYLGKDGAAVWRHSLLPYKSTDEYFEAIFWETDIMIICLGTNDTEYSINDSFCEEFKEDYKVLISALSNANPNARVYLCTISPMFGSQNASFAAKVPIINALIADVAEGCEASLIDINGAMASKPDLFSDGIHPNAMGAKIIAETVASAIERIVL